MGSGLGNAQEVTLRYSTNLIAQPHNDYLRLLVDQGVVGAVLLTVGLLVIARRSLRLAVRDAQHRALHVAALSATLGLMGCMLTDNPMVYIFVMMPTAVILGASIGVGRSLPRAVLVERVKVSPSAVVAACFVAAVLLIAFGF